MPSPLQTKVFNLVQEAPGEKVSIRRTHFSDDPRVVVVFEDDPSSADIRFAIAGALLRLVKDRVVRLVGAEGSTGVIDTSLLTSFPVAEVAERTAEYMVRQLMLSAAEFCHVLMKGEFLCHGVDSPELYAEALERFRKGDHFGVNQLGAKRAVVIADNLLGLMLTHDSPAAAITVTGNLPEPLFQALAKRDIGVVWVALAPDTNRNWERYLEVIRGKATLAKQVQDTCVFCGKLCTGPFLEISTGRVAGFDCFTEQINGAVIKTGLCLVCGRDCAQGAFTTTAGPVCFVCVKSGFAALSTEADLAGSDPAMGVHPMPTRIPWPRDAQLPDE